MLPETDLYLDTAERSKTVVVADDQTGFTTLVTMPLDIAKTSDLLLRATVGFTNDGAKPATVAYRVLLDGAVHHDFSLVDGAGGGEDTLSPVSFVCNGVPAGKHIVQLQARVDQYPVGGVSFGNRTMELTAFRLIPNPP